MCELFGFTGSKATDVGDYLEAFFKHSEMHPHGWGIMYEKGYRKHFREPVKASVSVKLPEVEKDIPAQKNMLAHIRYATVGSVRAENCHPFAQEDVSGREWTMIHNGTIYSGRNTYRYYKTQEGDTDSERLFLSFIDTINEALGHHGKLTEKDRFKVVNDFITVNAPRNKLNLIFYDGELMYVHKNFKNTLYFKRVEGGIVISTQPLDEGEWVPFPMAQVIAYRNGKVVYRGDRHDGVFTPTLEYITALDAMNL